MLGERKVNLFIAGAARSGTTTLYTCLAGHSRICMSRIKEPNYFSSEAVLNDHLYYQEPVKSVYEDYSACFNPLPGHTILGEASVSYLYYPGTAGRIAAYNPDARIILSLRHPVERAWSHYLMDKKLGYVRQSFRDVWNSRGEGKLALHYQQYFKYGLYSAQVKQFLDVFPAGQLKLVWFESLKANLPAVLQEISGFLHVPDEDLAAGLQGQNESQQASLRLVEILYRRRTLRKAVKMLVPARTGKALKKFIFDSASPRMEADLRKQLMDFYQPDILKLEVLTGKNLSSWHE